MSMFMMSSYNLSGTEELRAAAEYFGWQHGDFSAQFSAEELLKIYRFVRSPDGRKVNEACDTWGPTTLAKALGKRGKDARAWGTDNDEKENT